MAAPTGLSNLWITDAEHGTESRFTFDASDNVHPVWSPDGIKVAFGSNRGGGTYNLYQRASNNTGQDVLVFESMVPAKFPCDWSRDGRFITRPGMILGTAAYMSPEQAIGKSADRRSDIFSFGSVLFEMLTGQRAFKGETAGETLVSVAKDDPDWSKLPASLPSALQKLLRRCLVKDRKKRLQAIGEARLILEDLKAGGESSVLPPRALAGARATDCQTIRR